MSKYAQWMFTMQSVAIVLGYLILFLSLRPTASKRLLMASFYSLAALGLGALAVFPLFFGISMANAFGPSRVSPLAYISPCLIAVFFLLPALALFPFISIATARRIGIAVFGVVLPLILIIGAVAIYSGQGGDRGLVVIPRGLEALALTALWLRVYECRFSIPSEVA